MILFNDEKKWKYYMKSIKMYQAKNDKIEREDKLYKFPPNCKKETCQYFVEMTITPNDFIAFHVIFRGSHFIQIGFTDTPKKVICTYCCYLDF